MIDLTLEQWYDEYKELAQKEGLDWLCTGDKEDYKDIYQEISPIDCLMEDLEIAKLDA